MVPSTPGATCADLSTDLASSPLATTDWTKQGQLMQTLLWANWIFPPEILKMEHGNTT